MKKRDLIGKRFGRLIVLENIGKRVSRGVVWRCKCDCGQLVEVPTGSLRNGDTQSCGCLQRERAREANIKHGDSKTHLYGAWTNMKTRCLNPANPNYHRYGGRGIIICSEWKNSYFAFKEWALTNGYQDNLTIDRKENDGNYEPGNCRWVTRSKNTEKLWEERSIAINKAFIAGFRLGYALRVPRKFS